MAGVILYGAHRIETGALTAGGLVAFVLALGLAQMPIKKLNNAYLKLKNAEAAADRVYEIIDIPTIPVVSIPAYRLTQFSKQIRYENVGLCYGEKRALKGVSLEMVRGECVAFVGPSGSGKTSIVNLLPRLYELEEGSIRIDGKDIRDISIEDLRRHISIVTQDTFLFNDTLYENIRYGKIGASHREIERAAELAHCLAFIERSPEGFETRIGDRGVCLSGGERQRIAIARAFLKEAPILILDEATSNLDPRSEELVQSALDELMQGKTTLLVTHRYSILRRAERIFVLDKGRIRENGTHAELVAQSGIYFHLFQEESIGLQ